MRESAFWTSFAKELKKIPDIDFSRVENECEIGFPDVLVCQKGKYALIEIKVAKKMKIKLQPGQEGWHRRHTKAGGNVWVLWRDEDNVGIFKINSVPKHLLNNTELDISKIEQHDSSIVYGFSKPFAGRWAKLIEIIIKGDYT